MKEKYKNIIFALLFIFSIASFPKAVEAYFANDARSKTWEDCIKKLVTGVLKDSDFSDLKVTSVSSTWYEWISEFFNQTYFYYEATDDTHDFTGYVRAHLNTYEIADKRSGDVKESGWQCSLDTWIGAGIYFELINRKGASIYSLKALEKSSFQEQEEEEEQLPIIRFKEINEERDR
ncbi:MAG: hypothetical protein HYY61_01710 [Deltaproteobacteria bacterium]|nr:hypothetical protein [Deltaproteobacteria bacterium]